MHRIRYTAVLGAALLAGALLAGGLSLASCAQATETPSASSSAAAHDRANIMIYSINTDGPYLRAVVTGAIGDYGPAVAVHPDGTVDPEKASELELELTRGSFRLDIAELHQKFVKAASHEPVYPRTCSDVFGFTVAAPIVPGSGVGAYRGITGGFRMTLTADEVQASPCRQTLGIRWQVIMLAGPGTVSV